MQDRPTLRELLDAAEDWLRTDLRPQLTGAVQFHSLVVANVLGELPCASTSRMIGQSLTAGRSCSAALFMIDASDASVMPVVKPV